MRALTEYEKGYRGRVCGAPVVTVETTSQCTFAPFTALPERYRGRRVALVLLDADDTDYQNTRRPE